MRFARGALALLLVLASCTRTSPPPATEWVRFQVWALQESEIAREAARRETVATNPKPVRSASLQRLRRTHALSDEDLQAIAGEGRARRWIDRPLCAWRGEPFYQNPLLLAPETTRPLEPRTPSPCLPGVVVLAIVVNADGRLAEARVIRGSQGLGGELGREALRAVEVAEWLPALLCGRPVAVHYTVSVSFRCLPGGP